ncbi:substrate-binding periplasmic protein [Thalassotalea sp. PLHSN55]|uniref:substrate-binding periplasmic protein n=1 Tax=Thalassotalea sp. PLHSN55 TaxID=3435888 RepID=UPI003F83D8A3
MTNFFRQMKLISFFWVCNSIIFTAYAQQSIVVLVPNFPPYTEKKSDKIVGIGIELANQVFEKAGIAVNYHIYPNYAKVVDEIKRDKGSAFLLASQNAERDKIAVFSEPLFINRWCWYTLKNSSLTPLQEHFKLRAKVSTHFNANTHKWLISNDYFVQPVMETKKLPEMLARRYIDAAFIAELVFEDAIKEAGIAPNKFKKFVELEKDFGIYISKRYLAKYPETLIKVNQAIADIMSKKIIND